MKHRKLISGLLALTLLFIWGNSLLPREVSGAFSDAVMGVMNRMAAGMGLGEDAFTVLVDTDGDGEPEPSSHAVRKMAHVTEFAVLGGLLWLRLEGAKHRSRMTFLLGLSVAVTDETIQLFSHRGNQIGDVLIDAGGLLLSLVFIEAVIRVRNRKES